MNKASKQIHQCTHIYIAQARLVLPLSWGRAGIVSSGEGTEFTKNTANNNCNNNINLHTHDYVFPSASLLHWGEGCIPQFLGGVLSKSYYTPIPAILPYVCRILYMRGAQLTEAVNAL